MPTFTRNPGILRPVPACAQLALLCLLPGLACADVTLYQAMVPLQGATEADRTAGFGEALRVAAVRASGRRDAGSNGAIASAASDPSRYVQQYSTTSDRMLKVGFDGRGVEQLLQQAGLPLWPAERPVTLVQLFVPSVAGGSRAVLASERPPERDQVERAAQVRGLPIAWPQQVVDPGQARGRLASPGGATQAVLLGVASGSQVDWSFSHLDLRTRAQGGAQAGADLAADALASRYAPASTRSLNSVPVRVGGVTDVQAYAGLLEYLQTLSLVRSVDVAELAGDTVRLNLALRGDLELLRRIAALDTHLQAGVRPEVPGGDGTDFTWQP
jgi:hypothetical protein